MMSAFGTVETAVEAMKLGAYDYISKPFMSDEILLTLRKAQERETLRKENELLREEVEKAVITSYSIHYTKLYDLDLRREEFPAGGSGPGGERDLSCP